MTRSESAIRIAMPILLALFAGQIAYAEDPRVRVYKTPMCGCCTKWVEHLQAEGFAVEVADVDDLGQLKREKRVPAALSSCHTAIVDGYVVEGHVPAEDVRRLLRERPGVIGIAVPGMPEGSPGMEGPHPEAYEVLLFDAGGTTVFSRHGPAASQPGE